MEHADGADRGAGMHHAGTYALSVVSSAVSATQHGSCLGEGTIIVSPTTLGVLRALTVAPTANFHTYREDLIAAREQILHPRGLSWICEIYHPTRLRRRPANGLTRSSRSSNAKVLDARNFCWKDSLKPRAATARTFHTTLTPLISTRFPCRRKNTLRAPPSSSTR